MRGVIDRCRRIAQFSESTSGTTRTYLCDAMHDVHEYLGEWMRSLGMEVRVDPVGNLRGLHPGAREDAKRLLIGSHLDTVPNAGPFDGVLGVVLGIALVESLGGERLPFAIEVIGFSEEEGVRYGIPFLGSRALVGRFGQDLHELTREAIVKFGLDPALTDEAQMHPDSFAYLEFHIEQGPVLESMNQPLGVVTAIAGQSRWSVTFTGRANHAGTTPMNLRRDALVGAAEWICAVEAEAGDAVATVGTIEAQPGASNVIPAKVTASLDVRHASDALRMDCVERILAKGRAIAANRNLQFDAEPKLNQRAVQMDAELIAKAGDLPRLVSGAGHDAMIMEEKVPSIMFFVRTPGGISHHPDESVREEDVEIALSTGRKFLAALSC